MNFKSALIGAGAIVIALLAAYQMGRTSMRAEILAAPVARDTVIVYVERPVTPDTMHGSPVVPVQNPHNRVRIIAGASGPAGDTSGGTGAEIIDETGGNEALGYVYADTLTDHSGGTHALTFTYPSLVFDEVYRPGPDSDKVVTVTERVYVPADEPAFWLTGHAAYLGAGVSAGYKSIGVGCMWMNEQKPAPFISYTVRF